MSKIRDEFSLALPALFIAFVIWLIGKQADVETDRLSAAVEVRNVPPHMEIEAPRRISINLQYPKDLSNQILEKNFSVPIDAAELFNTDPTQWSPPNEPKEIDYTIKPNQIKSSAAQGIRVIAVDPQTVRLIGRLRTLALNIKVDTTGTLPANLALTAPPSPDPDKLLVTGPPEVLNRLVAQGSTVSTETIDLATLENSGQRFPEVKLPEGVVLLGRQSAKITVNFGLSEKPVKRAFSDVPVNLVTFRGDLKARTVPSAVEVVIEGPESALRGIKADDISFALAREVKEEPGRVSEVGLQARLKDTVSNDVAQQIKIVELRPARISVEFVPADEQN